MSSNDQDPNNTPKEGPKKPEWTPGRRLSRKGMSRDRGEDLNAHAKVEAQRKAARRATWRMRCVMPGMRPPATSNSRALIIG